MNDSHTVMTWYYGGESGVFNHQSQTALYQVIQQELSLLKVLYPHLEIQSLDKPVLFDDSNLNYPCQPLGISWVNEPFSKGSYSNFGLQSFEERNQEIRIEGERIKKGFEPVGGHLFFAGEHTDSNYPATMEGAVASSERAASLINRMLQLKLIDNKLAK